MEFFAMKLSEHVRSTHIGDGGVVLDILHGQMFRLNLVGSRMLELLNQGMTEAQIADAISRDTGAPREIVTADLKEFLNHLERNHLLQIRQAMSESCL
jgi:coenzyme PQQ synthesis protein D (PqqD)